MSKVASKIASLELNDGTLDLKRHTDIWSMRVNQLKLRETMQSPQIQASSEAFQAKDGSAGASDGELPGCAWISSAQELLGCLNDRITALEKDQELLMSLWFESINIRGDNLPAAHRDTFSWIFAGHLPDHSREITFVRWLSHENTTFWVNGKAGSGKSTLMKFLSSHATTMRHLKQWAGEQQLITSRFFFWNSGTSLQKSQIGLLRSILFEILRQCPELVGQVREAREQLIGRSNLKKAPKTTHSPEEITSTASHFSEPWTWGHEELIWVYQFIVEKKTASKFCFFIDGLDEYKAEGARDHQDLIRTIRLLASSPNIKLCVSSRPWVVFSDAFGSDDQWVLKLEDLTKTDIHQYVFDKLNEHDQYKKLSSSISGYSELIGEVVRKAQGVFLWVFLVVRDLLEGLTYNDTPRTMRLRLDQFPADLESYFEHMIASIPKFYRKETAQTFRIALAREEPLLLLSYAFVDEITEEPELGLETPIPKWKPDDLTKKYDTMRRRLDGRCRGLVEIVVDDRANNDFDSYKVDFLHRTARDFLLRADYVTELVGGDSMTDTRLWARVSRAVLLTMQTMSDHGLKGRSSRMWDDLLAFAHLGWRDGDDIPEIYDNLEWAESITADMVSGITLLKKACNYGLLPFVQRKLSGAWEAERRADAIISHALTPNPVTQGLCPKLVEYLIRLGSGPNKAESQSWSLPPGPPKPWRQLEYDIPVSEKSVFAKFMDDIRRGSISPSQDGVLSVTKILIEAGADLDLDKHYPELLISPKMIIRRNFSRSQSSWLLCEVDMDREAIRERRRRRLMDAAANRKRRRRQLMDEEDEEDEPAPKRSILDSAF